MIFRISLAVAFLAAISPAFAEDTPTVDMTTVMSDEAGKPIRDCPTGYDLKADPKQDGCPALTLGAAASYGVSYAVESDRQMDWKQKAELRWVVDHYRTSKSAELTNKQRDALMDRIGNIYKLIPQGDVVIVAAMKILQPVEFGKLGK